ncbi:MAG: cation:proton antiporter [Gammaproteobacteria bacterium]|nr:cation:proton antiporter [Gammaproteobacteria bacterium]MDH5799304.1 cation:proton antiporter [Gammaproteobacteria bacterium]
MNNETIVFTIFLIFTGAAVLATIALYARQSLLVAYILLGVFMGPSGVEWVSDPSLVKQIAHVGIIFLLFLLGMNLPPAKLVQLVKQTTFITGISSTLFGLIGAGVAWMFGFSTTDGIIVGAAMMFSSTIIGLKLLPTSILHHRHTGEIIISILLLQDFLAIFLLLFLSSGKGSVPIAAVGLLLLSLLGISLFAYAFSRWILMKVMLKFDKIPEYMFLITIGWCLGIAQLTHFAGLSYEIGAFIAGITLASNKIALYIAEILKPLRDFFLILFFFSIGALLDLRMAMDVFLPAIILAIALLLLKPLIFKGLLRQSGENPHVSLEVGVRLGQASEFSLLIAVLALDMSVISQQAGYLIQMSTLITFIVSSYLVVLRYPTPVAVSDKLRRD